MANKFVTLWNDFWSNLSILGRKGVDNMTSGADRIENLVENSADEIRRKRIELATIRGSLEHLREQLVTARRELAEADAAVAGDLTGLSQTELDGLSGILNEREAIVQALEVKIAEFETGLQTAKNAIQGHEATIRQQRALLPTLRLEEQTAEMSTSLSNVIAGPVSTGTQRQIQAEAARIRLKGHQARALLADASHPDDPQALLTRLSAGERTRQALERSKSRRDLALQGGTTSSEPLLLTPGVQEFGQRRMPGGAEATQRALLIGSGPSDKDE